MDTQVFTSPSMTLQDEILTSCNETLKALKMMLLDILNGRSELIKPFINTLKVTYCILDAPLRKVNPTLLERTTRLLDECLNDVNDNKAFMRDVGKQRKLADNLIILLTDYGTAIDELGIGIIIKKIGGVKK